MMDMVDIVVTRRIVVEVDIGGEAAVRTIRRIQIGGGVEWFML